MLQRLRQRKPETAPLALSSGFQPDLAAVQFDDAPDHRQTHADSVALTVQLFKYAKDFFEIFRGEADAVVADVEDHFTLLLFDADLYPGRSLIAHVLDGVVQQVLPDLQQTAKVAMQDGMRATGSWYREHGWV